MVAGNLKGFRSPKFADGTMEQQASGNCCVYGIVSTSQ